jgi:hypothetical protein
MEFPQEMISDALEQDDLGDTADAVNLFLGVSFILLGHRPSHPDARER